MTADLLRTIQRVLSAWDTTTLKTNGDGMLSDEVASLRTEFDRAIQSPAEGDELTDAQLDAAMPGPEQFETPAAPWTPRDRLILRAAMRAGAALVAQPNVQPKGLTSVCHIECDGCLDAGKCAFPGKPAEPVRYPHPDEDDAVTLWAEIHRLRAAVQGPDGYATWQEAATAERVRRVAAEKALAAAQAPAPAQGSWVRAEDVQRLARDLDVAINGEAAAAPAPQLCDVVAQAIGIMDARRAEFPVVARWTKNAKDGAPRARVWVQFEDGGPEVEFASDLQAPAVGADATVKESLQVAASDKQRLDWLEQNPGVTLEKLRATPRGGALLYWRIEDREGEYVGGWTDPEEVPTLRAAIDEAMSRSQPPVQPMGGAK